MTVDELKGAICKYFNDSADFSALFYGYYFTFIYTFVNQ